MWSFKNSCYWEGSLVFAKSSYLGYLSDSYKLALIGV